MTEKYTDGYDVFTEDEAWEYVQQAMTWDDYEEHFAKMNFSRFFEKVRQLPGFFEAFEDEFMEAESRYFDENFKRIEEENDDE